MPCTKDFKKEMLLGRLEEVEARLRQYGDLTRVEIAFNSLNVWPSFSRSASTHEDFASSSRTRSDEDRRIEEGISLLVRREKDGKKIFKCWTCDEFGHYASKCPKREKV